MSKINWQLLGALRFALATIVAVSHTQLFSQDNVSTAEITKLGGQASVLGFLLISGFSMAASLERETDGFYFRRFKRIYPLYLFFVLLAFAVQAAFGSFQTAYHTFAASGIIVAIGNLFLLQTFLVKPIAFNQAVWSLAIEASYYAISPLLRRVSVFFLIGATLLSIGYYISPPTSILLKITAIRYFWPFGVGFFLLSYRGTASFAVALVLATGAVCIFHEEAEPLAAVTVAFSVIVIFVASRWQWGVVWYGVIAEYLGDISYPFYLAHEPVYILGYRLFGLTGWELFAMSVAIAIAAYHLIDVRMKRVIFNRAKLQSRKSMAMTTQDLH